MEPPKEMLAHLGTPLANSPNVGYRPYPIILGDQTMATRVSYLYRDAGNYKQYGDFDVIGDFDAEAIEPLLIDGEFFIPEHVGIPSLVPIGKNDDDHDLHAFDGHERIDDSDASPHAIEFGELFERFRVQKSTNKRWMY
jgi:hypothetical protein